MSIVLSTYIHIYIVQCYSLFTAVHFFSQHRIKFSFKNSKSKKRGSIPKCLKPGFFINQLSLDPVYKLPSQISICYNVPGFGRLWNRFPDNTMELLRRSFQKNVWTLTYFCGLLVMKCTRSLLQKKEWRRVSVKDLKSLIKKTTWRPLHRGVVWKKCCIERKKAWAQFFGPGFIYWVCLRMKCWKWECRKCHVAVIKLMLFLLQNGMLVGMFAPKWHVWRICTKQLRGEISDQTWHLIAENLRRTLHFRKKNWAQVYIRDSGS